MKNAEQNSDVLRDTLTRQIIDRSKLLLVPHPENPYVKEGVYEHVRKYRRLIERELRKLSEGEIKIREFGDYMDNFLQGMESQLDKETYIKMLEIVMEVYELVDQTYYEMKMDQVGAQKVIEPEKDIDDVGVEEDNQAETVVGVVESERTMESEAKQKPIYDDYAELTVEDMMDVITGPDLPAAPVKSRAGDSFLVSVPAYDTVRDMQVRGEKVDPVLMQKISRLTQVSSLINYEYLTPAEIEEMSKEAARIEIMDRNELMNRMVDFAAVVLRAHSSYAKQPVQIVEAAQRIERAERDGQKYTPNAVTLDLVARGYIAVKYATIIGRYFPAEVINTDKTVMGDLKQNPEVSHQSQLYDGIEGLSVTLLMVRALEEKVMIKRQQESAEKLEEQLGELVRWHAEFTMKLFQNNQSLSDFTGHDANLVGEISYNTRFLRSIFMFIKARGFVSRKQMSMALQKFGEYRATMKGLLGARSDLMEIIEKPVERRKGDAPLALRELHCMLDDCGLGETSKSVYACVDFKAFQALNRLMIVLVGRKEASMHINLNKNSESLLNNPLVGYPCISKILVMNEQEYYEYQGRVYSELTKDNEGRPEGYQEFYTWVYRTFFEILDQYR